MQILLNKTDIPHNPSYGVGSKTQHQEQRQRSDGNKFINDVVKATIIYKPISNAQYIWQRIQYAKESIGFEPPHITRLKLKAIGIKSTFQETLRLFMPVYVLYVVNKALNNVENNAQKKHQDTFMSNNSNKLMLFILSNIISETLSRFPAEKFATIFVDKEKQTFTVPKLKQIFHNKGFWGTLAFIGGVALWDFVETQKQEKPPTKDKKEMNSAFGIGALYFAGRIFNTLLYTYQQTRDSLSIIPNTPLYKHFRRGRALSVGVRSLGQDVARAAVPLASLAVMNSYFRDKKDQDNIKPWIYGGSLAIFDVIYRKLGKDIFSIFVKKTPIALEGKNAFLESLTMPGLKEIKGNALFLRAASITLALTVSLGALKYNFHQSTPQQNKTGKPIDV